MRRVEVRTAQREASEWLLDFIDKHGEEVALAALDRALENIRSDLQI